MSLYGNTSSDRALPGALRTQNVTALQGALLHREVMNHLPPLRQNPRSISAPAQDNPAKVVTLD